MEEGCKRVFHATFQDKQMMKKGQIDLMKQIFIIDCRYGNSNKSPDQAGNEQDKDKAVVTGSQPNIYNDRVRVKKLIKKRVEKEQSQA